MYHFIGIKGSGMASLASILHGLGFEVQGSDIEEHLFTEDGLRELGIKILPFSADNIKEDMIIVKGNAFKDDHEEVFLFCSRPDRPARRLLQQGEGNSCRPRPCDGFDPYRVLQGHYRP